MHKYSEGKNKKNIQKKKFIVFCGGKPMIYGEGLHNNTMIFRIIKVFVYLGILGLLCTPVLAAPTVSSINPSVGPNTSLSITDISGTGFSSGATVRITNEIFNLTHKGKIIHPTGGSTLRQPYQVQISGNYAYIASLQSNALEIVDVSNPAAPTHVASLVNNSGGAVLNTVNSVFVSGNYAYLTPGAGFTLRGLEIVNITDPAHPVHESFLRDGTGGAVMNYPTSVFVSGNYAYVTARNSNSLEIINVTNKSAPVHAGSIVDGQGGALLQGAQRVIVSGNYAYVASATSNALEIVDVTDKAAPVHAGNIIDGQGGAVIFDPQGVAVQGNYAYVSSGFGIKNALEIVDISNPANPVHAAVLLNGQDGAQINFPLGLFVSGNFVYIANGGNLLSVVDISDPLNPRHEAYLSDGVGGASLKYATSVYVSDHYAYVSSRDSNALEIVDLGSTDWAPKGYSTGINVSSTTDIDAGVFNLTPLPEGRYNIVVINSDGTQGVLNQAFTISNVPPVPSFTGSPTSGGIPLTVTFTDNSVSPGIIFWNWSFGDAANTWYNTSDPSAKNSTFIYTSAGTFTVNLTVTNATGNSTLSRANYITAFQPGPIPNFRGTPLLGAAPVTVNFVDLSTGAGITSWNWSFGDPSHSWYNTTNPLAKDAQFTYFTAGKFTVSLTVTNGFGSNTFTIPDYVTSVAQGPDNSDNGPPGGSGNIVQPPATVAPTAAPTEMITPVATATAAATVALPVTVQPTLVTPLPSSVQTPAISTTMEAALQTSAAEHPSIFTTILSAIHEYQFWLILVAVAIIMVVILNQWRIRRQNPALFRKMR